jgi:hypothetical protein
MSGTCPHRRRVVVAAASSSASAGAVSSRRARTASPASRPMRRKAWAKKYQIVKGLAYQLVDAISRRARRISSMAATAGRVSSHSPR